MGTDKALLVLDGSLLIERALAQARAISSTVFLVGTQRKLSRFGPVIEDIYPGCGPLGGIHAALSGSETELNLILAVDTPFVSLAFLRFLVSTAEQSRTVVTAPRTARGWHPLCAVYRRSFADAAGQALKAGHNRVDSLFAVVPVRAIEEAELRRLAFDPEMLDNLNTREDWQRAQERAGRT
jgi:molybdopterin-guanine dinucleotide biosynthesis protein A